MSLNFAAIDFETADEKKDSACALSIVIVIDGAVSEQLSYLIRPPRPYIIYSYIHNIYWSDVAEKPVFGDIWPKLIPKLRKIKFFAAHNAPFDRSVLHACCSKASLNPPSIPFICTVQLARKIWGIYPTKLPDVCRRLKIDLNHHDASSDAMACAKIVLSAHNSNTLYPYLNAKARTLI